MTNPNSRSIGEEREKEKENRIISFPLFKGRYNYNENYQEQEMRSQ